MATAEALKNGLISDDILSYYDVKTRGGYLALAIVEHSYVHFPGKASDRQISTASDDMIPGLRKLAATFHKNQVKAAMQLNHAGSAAPGQCVGPSPLPHPLRQTVPAQLSQDQIKEIVSAFQHAALRVKTAGFDAVEIHAAHGYLLN